MDQSEEPSSVGNVCSVHEGEMYVQSDPMRRLMALVQRVASNPASVLITGPTGTGKELVARAIHYYSSRRDQAFIDVNCSALPEHLIESELFGYEKGAFSGADQMKPGMFELADQGTLFLDEIGELDSKMQAKLLRVLDGHAYFRLGGRQKIKINVRLIAATNRNLAEAIDRGLFRSDLYYRICQFQLRVPALSDRLEETVGLATHFLRGIAPDCDFTEEALSAIKNYSWPGNVRELRNVVTHAAAVRNSNVITLEDLPESFPQARSLNEEEDLQSATTLDLDHLERTTIQVALENSDGHQGQAAQRLGISRRTLSRKLRQFRTEQPSQALGAIAREQEEVFRSRTAIPITISAGKQMLRLISVDVGMGGIGVNLPDPSEFSGKTLDLQLQLPGGQTIAARGKVVWSDPTGRSGIKFVDFIANGREKLGSWISETISREGWEKLGAGRLD